MFLRVRQWTHRRRNRNLRGSPLAKHYSSNQGQSMITTHVSSEHARKDVFILYPFFSLFSRKKVEI